MLRCEEFFRISHVKIDWKNSPNRGHSKEMSTEKKKKHNLKAESYVLFGEQI